MKLPLEKIVKNLFKEKNFLEIIKLSSEHQQEFNDNLVLIEALCLANYNLENKVETVKNAKHILSKDPKHIGANHILAKVLSFSSIDDSIYYYKKLLNFSNNSINYLTEYMTFLYSLGAFNELIEILEKLTKKHPSNLSFKITLAKVKIENNDFDEAILVLDNILNYSKLLTKKDEILNMIGTVYHQKNEYEFAKNYYQKSFKSNNSNIEPLKNLAILEQEFGYFDKAREILDRINKIKKDAECYRLISANKKFVDEKDNDLLIMLGMNSSASLKDNEKISLHFALGKAYEDIKDYSKSSSFYSSANKLRRSSFKNYDFKKELQIIEEMISIFDQKFFENFSSNNNLGEGLVFIVGMPRSGTTLLEQILSSHKDLFGAGELNFFTQSIDNALKVFDFENYKKKILNFKEKKEILEIGNLYLKKINANIRKFTKKKFIIDKNPMNFRNIPLIYASLPKAKVIHIKRDQNDNVLSIYKNYFHQNVMPWSYSQIELKQYYNSYNKYMKSLKKNFSNFIFEINYENLTSDLENEIKKVLEFLGINWDPNCLNFYKNERAVRTASINQVRQKIYQTSKNKWTFYSKFFQDLFV